MKKITSYILVLLVAVIFLSHINLVSAGGIIIPPTDAPVPVTPAAVPKGDSKVYSLLAPIGNLFCITTDTTADPVKSAGCASGGVGAYFNIFFKLIIGLAAVLAIIKIVISGIQYMGGGSVFSVEEAKSGIGSALLGLFIALGAYLILYTINPAFLDSNIQIDQASIELKAVEYMPAADYQRITGNLTLSPGQYDSLAKQAAINTHIPSCAMSVILRRESRSNPGAIGYDSNVANNGIPARRTFISSKIKYSGTTFATTDSSITDKSLKNDDDKNFTTTDGLGLDWRFSHGIGLTQTTCQPTRTDFSGRNNLPNCNFGGTSYTPKQLLDPVKNLEAGSRIWAGFYNQCSQNINGTWRAYISGSCNSTNAYAVSEANTRTDLYNQCAKQNP
jgi:hypothetical protein